MRNSSHGLRSHRCCRSDEAASTVAPWPGTNAASGRRRREPVPKSPAIAVGIAAITGSPDSSTRSPQKTMTGCCRPPRRSGRAGVTTPGMDRHRPRRDRRRPRSMFGAPYAERPCPLRVARGAPHRCPDARLGIAPPLRGAQYTAAPRMPMTPKWSKWLCVKTIWLTALSDLRTSLYGVASAASSPGRSAACPPAPHHADGDVEKRQTAAMYALTQRLPREVHLTQRQRLGRPILVEHLGAGSASYRRDTERPLRRRIRLRQRPSRLPGRAQRHVLRGRRHMHRPAPDRRCDARTASERAPRRPG